MAVNLQPLLDAVDFATISNALITVASLFVVLHVTYRAVNFVLFLFKPRGFTRFGGRLWDDQTYTAAMHHVKREVLSGRLVDRESREALARFEGFSRRPGRTRSRPLRRF